MQFLKYQNRTGNSQEKFINKCLAYKAYFEEEYSSAYDHFIKCSSTKDFDPMGKCHDILWLTNDYEKLIVFHTTHLTQASPIQKNRLQVARLLSENSISNQIILDKGLEMEKAVLEDDYSYISSKERPFYSKLVKVFRNDFNKLVGREKEVADKLSSFRSNNEKLVKLIADFYYEGENYQIAYNHWSDINHVEHDKFYECGAKLYSKGKRVDEIYFLDKLNKSKRF